MAVDCSLLVTGIQLHQIFEKFELPTARADMDVKAASVIDLRTHCLQGVGDGGDLFQALLAAQHRRHEFKADTTADFVGDRAVRHDLPVAAGRRVRRVHNEAGTALQFRRRLLARERIAGKETLQIRSRKCKRREPVFIFVVS